MSDKVFLGRRMAQLDTSPALEPVSKVILAVDNENAYVAGDDTGRTVELTCPYGTQAMADNILTALENVVYIPAQAQDAILDPAAELGDGITMGSVYTVLGQMDLEFDSLMTSDGGAPGQAEQESEYQYQSPVLSQINYEIAQTRSEITKTATEIRLEVENELDGLSASIDIQINSITSQITGLNGQVSTIQQTVSSITTQITGINGDISSLEQTANSLQTQIRNAQGDISTIEQYVDSITLSVSNGSTSSTIQLKAGNTTISSENITFSGVVTFTDLSTSGATTINGNNITTGTIDADRLNLTGAITFSDLSSSVQNDIENAALDAQDALDAADDVSRTVDRWTYEGTTYIDGGRIMTGTVSASTLEGGEIYLLDASGRRAGSFTLEGSSSSSGRAIRIESGAIAIMSQAGDVYLESGDGATLQLSDDCAFAADIRPSSAGRYSCGTSSRPWSDVYAESGTVSTSDRNKKHDIEPLPDKYVAMLDLVLPKRFKLNSGTSGRCHVGFVAQDVEAAMEAVGIDSLEFGGWVKDQDENGEDVYMLRYTEFIAILWAKIKALEARLEANA